MASFAGMAKAKTGMEFGWGGFNSRGSFLTGNFEI